MTNKLTKEQKESFNAQMARAKDRLNWFKGHIPDIKDKTMDTVNIELLYDMSAYLIETCSLAHMLSPFEEYSDEVLSIMFEITAPIPYMDCDAGCWNFNPIKEAIYVQMNKSSQAIPRIDSPLGYENCWYIYGICLMNVGRYEEAEHAFNEALKWNPLDSGAMLELASIALEEEDWDEAIKQSKKALTCEPDSKVIARAYRTMGFGLVEKGKYNCAIDVYAVSLLYDEDNNGMVAKECDYIAEKTGKDVKLDINRAIRRLRKNGYQVGPSKAVVKGLTFLFDTVNKCMQDSKCMQNSEYNEKFSNKIENLLFGDLPEGTNIESIEVREEMITQKLKAASEEEKIEFMSKFTNAVSQYLDDIKQEENGEKGQFLQYLDLGAEVFNLIKRLNQYELSHKIYEELLKAE